MRCGGMIFSSLTNQSAPSKPIPVGKSLQTFAILDRWTAIYKEIVVNVQEAQDVYHRHRRMFKTYETIWRNSVSQSIRVMTHLTPLTCGFVVRRQQRRILEVPVEAT